MADDSAAAAADTHDVAQLEPATEEDFEFSENRAADAATAEDPAVLLSESAADGLPAEETDAENAINDADLSEPQHWGGGESKADRDDFRQVDADASTGLSRSIGVGTPELKTTSMMSSSLATMQQQLTTLTTCPSLPTSRAKLSMQRSKREKPALRALKPA
jgi:hypothetical protein